MAFVSTHVDIHYGSRVSINFDTFRAEVTNRGRTDTFQLQSMELFYGLTVPVEDMEVDFQEDRGKLVKPDEFVESPHLRAIVLNTIPKVIVYNVIRQGTYGCYLTIECDIAEGNLGMIFYGVRNLPMPLLR